MIGIFDSGFGGLTVLSALLKELPEYDYLYLGDSARNPYGNHSKETILNFTREGVQHLFNNGANLVILACNAASANALRDLQEELIRKPGVKGRNVLGVIVPIAEAIEESGAKNIAVIGTRATINSEVYDAEIKKRVDSFSLHSKACPLLVPLIEEGWADKMETKRILKYYLKDLKTYHPEILVPACTHYPILMKDIKQIMGKKTKVLDTGKIVANKLKDYLKRHPEINLNLEKNGNIIFQSTDAPEKFAELGSKFLGRKIAKVDHVNINI